MNLSGVAVRKVLARDHVPLEDMLVVVDDFDLPLGRLRLRDEGSAGTHNGLRSIVAEMGTQKFARLRVGIGGHGGSAVDHVLSAFAPEEQADLELVLDAAADAVESWARDGGARAANRWNAWRLPEPTDTIGLPVRRYLDTLAGLTVAIRPPARPAWRTPRLAVARCGRHRADPDRLASAAADRSATAADDRATHRVAWPAGTRPAHRRPGRGGDRVRELQLAAPRPTDGARHRIPDLAALTGHPRRARAPCDDLASRLTSQGTVGAGLRHVTYAGIPHGAKTYLAAALVQATGQRLLWIARDAEIADRAAEELVAWLGDPAAVVTLEPRTALAWERSELVRDESAARVATLAAWSDGGCPGAVLVASVQALFQRTLAPGPAARDSARAAAGSASVAGPGAPRARRPGLRDGARGRRSG